MDKKKKLEKGIAALNINTDGLYICCQYLKENNIKSQDSNILNTIFRKIIFAKILIKYDYYINKLSSRNFYFYNTISMKNRASKVLSRIHILNFFQN